HSDIQCSLLLTLRRPLLSPLFPYTTLFRSSDRDGIALREALGAQPNPCEPLLILLDVSGDLVGQRCVRRDQQGFTRIGLSAEGRSEEHTSELQSLAYLVCRLLLEKKKKLKICDGLRMPVWIGSPATTFAGTVPVANGSWLAVRGTPLVSSRNWIVSPAADEPSVAA